MKPAVFHTCQHPSSGKTLKNIRKRIAQIEYLDESGLIGGS
jgi:hypothetical protein